MGPRALSLSVAGAVVLAAVALGAVAGTGSDRRSFAAAVARCPHADESNCFADVDTGEANGVTFQIFVDGEPRSKIMVLEGQMGRVDFGPGKMTVGFVPEEISTRGDSVRVAFYSVENHLRPGQSRTWIEDLTLTTGDQIPLEGVGERIGQPDLEIKLIGATLASR